METWKSVSGYSKYSISDLGNVRNDRDNITLKPRITEKGYIAYVLYNDTGRPRSIKAHVLVCEAYISNPSGLPEINHIDEDKTNNEKVNLEWTDRSTNMIHSTGLTFKVLSPNGKVITAKGLTKFCRDNQLSQPAMSNVLSGKRKHHRGWKLTH